YGARVKELGEIKIDIAYAGSCTAGKEHDLDFYATVLQDALNSGRRGNLVIRVQIEVPKKLTKRQKEILAEYQELSEESPGPLSQGFFEKVKEIFG
ncbi:MAG: molecular chaperone DnaJ, partial [Deltaproteobacteria bacterium]